MEEKEYGFKSDVYSLGVLLYRLVEGNYPFGGSFERHILDDIRENKVKFKNTSLSEEFKDLICKMLTFDVDKRISLNEILKAKIFQEDSVLKSEIVKINETSEKRKSLFLDFLPPDIS
jgi:serine/threonine protein kinase